MSRSDYGGSGELIGKGSFSHVFRVTEKATDIEYAMKVVSKALIVREKKMESPMREKQALNMLKGSSNIVTLEKTFQDETSLYFVFEYLPNGTLDQKFGKLNENSIRIICAQILLCLANIHSRGIIHRDIKPNNFVFDDKNRVRLIDFGSCKIFDIEKKSHLVRASFVGCIDFIPPEIVTDGPQTPSLDLWSFGCLIYQMFDGHPPFEEETRMATYQRIEKCKYKMTERIPPVAQDLISKLLLLDPKKRLGCDEENDKYLSIREHPFFNGINWDTVSDEACF